MLKDRAPKGAAGSIGKARRLRREMTLPEILLWQMLRRKPDGLKFRWQHPSAVYILDFYCSDARLAIEVDGESHGRGDRPLRDQGRDAWLLAHGVETLRIPATEVLSDVETACRHIVTRAIARLPLHHPAAPGGPPPQDRLGEDL